MSDAAVEVLKIVAAPLVSVIGLGWWLRGQFNNVSRSNIEWLQTHEAQDERRHRQNLMRFTKIGMKLGITDLERDQEDA